MNKIPTNTLILLALSAAAIVTACGKRTETEKTTTVIERSVPQAPQTSDEGGHMQRAGEKIDRKVDEKIDRAIDSMLE